ncbi:MAG: hypothetical protein KDI09_02715 [Halioglobus sp.]|nr:hypothetical protein [Halioglobus sp.]
MNPEDYIAEALALVSGWDVEAEDFAQAVNEQAQLMAGLHPDASLDLSQYPPYTALRF